MNRSFLTLRRVLVGLVVALILSSLSPGQAARWIADKPSRIVAALTRPVVTVLTQLNGAVRGTANQRSDQVDPDRLYDEVLVEIAKLRQQLTDAHERITQLSGATQVLGMEEPHLVPARVIDASVKRSMRNMTIDHGRRHGIHDGQVVVDGVNLVGFVDRTGTVTADVRLITAPNETIQLDETGHRFIVRVAKNKNVAIGEVARLIDRTYPREAHFFVVGTVKEVKEDASDPLMHDVVIIEPSVSLHHLRHVIVLVPSDEK